MKKKILIFLAILAVACCFFAVSASAAEIPEWTEITEVSGIPDKSVFGADGTSGATSRVLMSDGVTYPAHYICKNSSTLGISFSDLNSKAGKSYAAKDVVRIELPSGIVTVSDALKIANGYTALLTVVIPEGAKTISDYAFKSTNASTHSSLIYVTIPNTVNSIGLQAFAFCNSLKELIIPEGVTSISKELARDATSLEKLIIPSTIVSIGEAAFRSSKVSCDIVIPEGCTTISSYAFRGSGALSVVLPSTIKTLGIYIFSESNSLVSVDSKSPIIGEYMFSDCTELCSVKLENTVEIKQRGFNHATASKIDEIILPEGLTTIGDYALPRSQITELVLPSTLANIGANAFYNSTKLQRVVVLGTSTGTNMFSGCSALSELVLTERFEKFGKSCLNSVSQTKFLTYYTGTDYERIKTLCSETTRFSQAKYYTYEDYANENYTYNKFMVIYDVNLCVAAFDGVHTEPNDDGDCTTAVICTMCKEHTFKEAKTHVVGERFTYVSFMQKGEYYVGCTNDGCENGTLEQRDALFTYLGYSVPEDGSGGVDFGCKVNGEDLAEYERVTGVKVNYGVFAVLKEKLGENDIFDENGESLAGVVSADFAGTDFSLFKIKMIGFTDEQKKTSFAMGAYVCVTENGVREYTYMQHSEPIDGEKYYFATYNDIFKSSDEE